MSIDEDWLHSIDVSAWEHSQEETRGVREKVWLEDADSNLWLRKSPLNAGARQRPFEPAIETIALGLARAAGLDAAYARPCTWRPEPASPERKGLVVKRFVNRTNEELHAGLELLRGREPGEYDPNDHAMHTLERCRAVLVEEGAGMQTNLLVPFVDMLVFDAWVGNGDRHQENWSVIRTHGDTELVSTKLAPIYDVAACFGAELLDANPLLSTTDPQKLLSYVERCPSGFGGNQFSMPDVVAEARGWPEWKPACDRLLPVFAGLLENQIPSWLRALDNSLLPQVRKDFLACTLRMRLEWLEKKQ